MPYTNVNNYRSAVLNEPRLASSSSPSTILRTPVGNVRSSVTTTNNYPPPLPPSPYQTSTAITSPSIYSGIGGYASPIYGGLGGFSGYGGYGTGYSNYGVGYGAYNRYSSGFGGSYLNPNDPENQFIQIAEESSRPAFQSIESLVAAIGNIAAMLDSTFFAITSSFRAILGVAANFGRLRGVFAQFWQTFAIFRGLTWIYKKLLYWLRISKIDPSSVIFKEAFAAAASQTTSNGLPNVPHSISAHTRGQSPWPVIAFLSFIFTAPYIIMKLLGNVAKSAKEESRDPKTWINPIQSQVLFDFNSRNPLELTIRSGQTILIAPREIQNTHNLLKTGWLLGTVDNQISGLVPHNYIQKPVQYRKFQEEQIQNLQKQQQENVNVVKSDNDKEQQDQQYQQQQHHDNSNKYQEENLDNLSSNNEIHQTDKIKEILRSTLPSKSVGGGSSNTNNNSNHHSSHSHSHSNSNGSPKNSLSRRNSNSLSVIPEIDIDDSTEI